MYLRSPFIIYKKEQINPGLARQRHTHLAVMVTDQSAQDKRITDTAAGRMHAAFCMEIIDMKRREL